MKDRGVKSVRIRSFSGLHFAAFRLNTKIYFANLENADLENSEYGHFLRSGKCL